MSPVASSRADGGFPLGRSIRFLGVRFDDAERQTILDWLLARTSADSFTYVVTPNVDHIVRLHECPEWEELQAAYADASLCLNDSRVLSRIAALKRRILPVVAGSDLTAELVSRHLGPQTRLLLIGGEADTPAVLKQRYGLINVRQHRPPMGLLTNDAALNECADIALSEPFDYVLLAVGSPQQEIIAHRIAARPGARGTALCIGASIDFITGKALRAPRWMQVLALEWLFRLLHNPRRLWRRYLLHSPKIFRIALSE